MIIVDTNVVSETMKPAADPAVTAWLNRQNSETLYLTAINLAELAGGIAMMPDGRRKQVMQSALSLFREGISPAVLAFDEAAAVAYAALMRAARDSGVALSAMDGQIAAIATVHGYTVATRDVAPFLAAGLSVVNPWEE